ncbi:hypothetical protein BS329_28805 [Amycolatopsis coloradensis]|uniref:Lipoprotein n=1 Tax=Amycolatopsis coloradensis TaxID=76021 RepID=A0A1R0KME8_9PSEU|nr:hypothetical protein [Amycolatopsis coloradensis]OLZ47860.1 hypothetical protein BS329_28805 [Amycolatopsis coloradensis]
MIRRLCAALSAVLLTAGLVACSPPNTGRVVPRAGSESLRDSSGVPIPPPPTSTTTPPPGPQPPEKHSGKGSATVTMAWPMRLGFVTFDCPKCSGHVAVNTENELIVNDSGPYKGTQWINDMPGYRAKTFTIKANAAWTLTITDESGLPVLEQGKSLSGKSEAVFSVPGTVSSVAVTTKNSGRTAVWVHSDEFSDLPVNQLGDYKGDVPVPGPAFVSIEGDGTWTVTAS